MDSSASRQCRQTISQSFARKRIGPHSRVDTRMTGKPCHHRTTAINHGLSPHEALGLDHQTQRTCYSSPGLLLSNPPFSGGCVDRSSHSRDP
ncbi:hypothetical protein MRB53_037398 [Persea americana]|nr:hypothetical protein MRB53_037398 [Persea americana]